MNMASPRRGSPPVIAAAWIRSCVRSCAYSQMLPTSAITATTAARTAKDALVESDRMGALRNLQPFIETDECGDSVHHSAGNPHHHASELLIGDRIEADAAHPHRGIIAIPGR